MSGLPAVWMPALRAGTGSDVFTQQLVDALRARGVRAEIEWLPLRREFLWPKRRLRTPEWADVIHINSRMPPGLVDRARPMVATVHHASEAPEAIEHKDPLRRVYHALLARGEGLNLARARHIVAVSNFAARTIAARAGGRPVEVIHNAVDSSTFAPSRRSGSGICRLAYVGKWSKLKGVATLGPLMQRLGEGFELHHTGPTQPDIARSVALGRLDRRGVAALLQGSDILVFPSRSEGFGLSVIEAMSCGCVPVANRLASLPEIIDHDVNGVLVDPGCIDEWVGAVRGLDADPARRREMAAHARKKVLSEFSMDRMVEKYLAVYLEAAGAGRPHR